MRCFPATSQGAQPYTMCTYRAMPEAWMATDSRIFWRSTDLFEGLVCVNKERDAPGIPAILGGCLPNRVNGDLCPYQDAIRNMVGREVVTLPGKSYLHEGAGVKVPGGITNGDWAVLPVGIGA